MGDETCGERKHRHACVAAIAAPQWGNATTEQLRSCGLSHAAITRWVATGKLTREFPRVYSVGHRSPAPQARWAAALLYAGAESALSHWSAAANLGLCAPRSTTQVVVARRTRPQPRLEIHAVPLRRGDLILANGLRTTTVVRTLLDLAAAGEDVERLVAGAVARRMTTIAAVKAYLARCSGARGAARLRRSIEGELTRSRVEKEFAAWLRSRGLPVPSMNHAIGPLSVDGFWEDAGLAVEIDTYGTHGTPHSFEDDRVRDAYLVARGLRTIRVTPRRWRDDGDRLERDIRAARSHGSRNLR